MLCQRVKEKKKKGGGGTYDKPQSNRSSSETETNEWKYYTEIVNNVYGFDKFDYK
jgi:hypothetical protein